MNSKRIKNSYVQINPNRSRDQTGATGREGGGLVKEEDGPPKQQKEAGERGVFAMQRTWWKVKPGGKTSVAKASKASYERQQETRI